MRLTAILGASRGAHDPAPPQWARCAPGRAATGRQRKSRLPRLRVATDDPALEVDPAQLDGGDYYSILGLQPGATTQDIKRAYRAAMKDYHPDQSMDSENTDFAVFLNLVYETLMDDDSRAEYDMISGFTVGGINPFVDKSYPPDYVFVDEFACIGCRNCNGVCPKSFMMEEEHGRARVYRQGIDSVDKLQEAIDTCPVSCIHWVTAPQLTLLEDAMAKMERVSAWLLMSSGGRGSNLNVFFEASIAWEKRQSDLKAHEERARWAWAPFAPAAGSAMRNSAGRKPAADPTDGNEAEEPAAGGSARRGRRVDAESIAAGARRWRDFQRAKRAKTRRLLTAAAGGTPPAAQPSAEIQV